MLLSTQLVAGLLPTAFAAETADVYRGTLIVEGISTSCQDANGADIPVLNYEGSTYVPLRAVGQWMGKEVSWDAAARTIALRGNNTSLFLRTPLTDAQKQEMQTYLDALDEIGVQLKALSQKL